MTPDARIQFFYDIQTNTCKLVMANASEADVGVYSCRASNPAGRATCTANVVVVRKYYIFLQLVCIPDFKLSVLFG